MDNIIRKSIAFDPEELNEFDKIIKKKGYKNRSLAIRDLVRESVSQDEQQDPEKKLMGVLTIVYNHDHGVQHELTHRQHHSPGLIVTTLHNHLDEHNCMEVLILKGKVKEISTFSDRIISTKGIKHGKLVLTNVS